MTNFSILKFMEEQKRKPGRPRLFEDEPTKPKTIRATETFFSAWLSREFRMACEQLAREFTKGKPDDKNKH